MMPRSFRLCTCRSAVIAVLVVTATTTAAFGVAGPASAQEERRARERLVPVATPTGQRDPAVAAFLTRLTTIVKQRDAAALLALVAEDIDVEFGKARGREAFTAAWEINDPASPFWRDVEWLLSFSTRYLEWGHYWLPYVHKKAPAGHDIGEAVVIVPNEPLRAEPSARARIITALSYEFVEEDDSIDRPYDREHHVDTVEPVPGRWIKVRIADGRKGYVRARHLYALGGPRLCIGQKDGQWRIVAYVVGD